MPKPKRQTPFSAKLSNVAKKLPPKKPKNTDCRQREYLMDSEVERLRKAASRCGRQGLRDDPSVPGNVRQIYGKLKSMRAVRQIASWNQQIRPNLF